MQELYGQGKKGFSLRLAGEHIVHPPPLPFILGWARNQFFKKWGLDRTSIFGGRLLGKYFVFFVFFQVDLQFLHKKWTKISNICWQKKFISENVFLCHN